MVPEIQAGGGDLNLKISSSGWTLNFNLDQYVLTTSKKNFAKCCSRKYPYPPWRVTEIPRGRGSGKVKWGGG